MRLTNEEIHRCLQIPTGRLRLVIDSDAKNEVDDQFAIAWALRSRDRCEVEAVYAAPFSHDASPLDQTENGRKSACLHGSASDPGDGMEQSYQEIRKLFDLLHEDPAGRVFRGKPCGAGSGPPGYAE